jgi:hypothetical protein
MGDECKEAVQSGEPTVARTDGHLPVFFQVIKEGENLAGLKVGQRKLRDLTPFTLRYKSQEQFPSVAI